jgi:RecJ-like exonuclease
VGLRETADGQVYCDCCRRYGEFIECWYCKGKGFITTTEYNMPTTYPSTPSTFVSVSEVKHDCTHCDGTGKVVR